jgi:DNA-binding transcriptional MocR family regulator
MSAYVQNFVWSLDLPPFDKLVAIALADHARHDGTNAYPSQNTLARKTGLSIHTVRRSLTLLRASEVIVMTRQHNQRNSRCYVFPLPKGYTSFKDVPQIPPPALRGISRTSRRISEAPLEVSDGYPNHKELSLEPDSGFNSSTSVPMPQDFKDAKNRLKKASASL